MDKTRKKIIKHNRIFNNITDEQYNKLMFKLVEFSYDNPNFIYYVAEQEKELSNLCFHHNTYINIETVPMTSAEYHEFSRINLI